VKGCSAPLCHSRKFLTLISCCTYIHSQKEAEATKQALATRKAVEQKKKEELAELFKPVQTQQKVPFGVDPKTVLCAFFKLGQCQKGNKCKFSHDLAVERKGEKIDLYTDQRTSVDDKAKGKCCRLL
jgi:hypothetical protein